MAMGSGPTGKQWLWMYQNQQYILMYIIMKTAMDVMHETWMAKHKTAVTP